MTFNRALKLKLLLIPVVVALAALIVADPIPQDLAYHQFADQVNRASIPNFWNVVSNLPFILMGIYGLIRISRKDISTSDNIQRTIYLLFFTGMLLTGLGSGWYHLSPSNETLLWDRLPMTISFMAFFSFVLSHHISPEFGKKGLWPLLILGILSVLYWAWTETQNSGDLRLYAAVQFLPVILIPLILLLLPSSTCRQNYIWLIIAAYVMAKVMEVYDAEIYSLLAISGHSLKHVIAASTGIFFIHAVKRPVQG